MVAAGGLALVVPCYNEEERLRSAAFVSYLAETPTVRLIFVDDGSSDGTNCGKAEAVRRGMLHALESDAQYGAVGFWDSDLATPLSAVAELHSVLCSNPALQMVQGGTEAAAETPSFEHSIFECVSAAAASVRFPLHEWVDVAGSKLRLTDVARMAYGLCQIYATYFLHEWPSGEPCTAAQATARRLLFAWGALLCTLLATLAAPLLWWRLL
ncbi:hypothetical protein EMIHUDRAFT_456488 [Emiliania huxleyi CCMP1516]|uniref:Glycosyltransferase 2-like domain-containing protein n=2 Tax=Emiliania huxleyi TaxID=2903 RepID=A0A0D3K4P5_EMIH1|nr:hypothetical protein EMIHUDRAFT_456488 [Emiliania huxleyi CCMP1516]EOD30730.1 hypothetical protein EMIHUDRAFT_456488 [Emiliania huxleyi CCMP1516]|eukprot:XP_005783159.1 hypothetical protein EMIHUDRAFT_456488 [Emiliania huxleyi CCMP1516]